MSSRTTALLVWLFLGGGCISADRPAQLPRAQDADATPAEDIAPPLPERCPSGGADLASFLIVERLYRTNEKDSVDISPAALWLADYSDDTVLVATRLGAPSLDSVVILALVAPLLLAEEIDGYLPADSLGQWQRVPAHLFDTPGQLSEWQTRVRLNIRQLMTWARGPDTEQDLSQLALLSWRGGICGSRTLRVATPI